jgi:hypothetical protein
MNSQKNGESFKAFWNSTLNKAQYEEFKNLNCKENPYKISYFEENKCQKIPDFLGVEQNFLVYKKL